MSDQIAINYIEFAVADTGRAKGFYGKAFGWTFTDYGPGYTSFTDGAMQGGFDAQIALRPGGPLVVLYTSDLADAEARVRAAGGAIVRPVFDFPGGRRFHFTDPDGNELAVWSES